MPHYSMDGGVCVLEAPRKSALDAHEEVSAGGRRDVFEQLNEHGAQGLEILAESQGHKAVARGFSVLLQGFRRSELHGVAACMLWCVF